MTKKTKYKTSIRKKIALIIFFSAFTVISIIMILGYFWSADLLRRTIGQNYLEMAQLLSAATSRIINEEISDLRVYMSHEERINKAQNSNLQYAGMSGEELKAYFETKDRQWMAEGSNNELVQEILDNSVSKRLISIKDNDEGLAEVMITDAFGALVAASGKTSDFYQADEKWWQVAYSDGKGGVSIEDVEFDESSRSLSVSLAIPVKNVSGEVVGTCKAVLDINRLFSALEDFKFGKTGHVILVDYFGNIMFHHELKSIGKELINARDLKTLLENQDNYAVVDNTRIHKNKGLIAWSLVEQPDLFKGGSPWIIFVYQDYGEVFAPLWSLEVQTLVIFFISLVALSALGFFVSSLFVKPIKKLEEATARISSGDLDYKVSINTDDEMERLADAFNEMSANLKTNTTSIKNLNKEIIERQKAEEEIKKVLKTTRGILAKAPFGIYVVNEKGGIDYANPAMLSISGDTNEQFYSLNVFELPPYKELGLVEKIKRTLKEESFSLKAVKYTSYVGKKSSIRNITGIPYQEEGKKKALIFVEDVTEREIIAGKLRKREELYRLLVQTIPDIIYEFDSQGNFIFVSDAVKELGYEPAELVGKNFKTFIHPSDYEAIDREITPPQDFGEVSGKRQTPIDKELGIEIKATRGLEVKIIPRDNKEFFESLYYAEINASGEWEKPLNGQGWKFLGSIGVARNIGKRKKVEEKLRQAALEWERTFESISDFVFIQNKDFTIIKANKAFIEAMGGEPEAVIGKKCYQVLHKSHAPWPGCPFEKTLTDNKPHTEEIDDPHIGLPLLVTTSPIFDDSGILIGNVHIAKDITESKKAKEGLLRANEELRRLDKLKSEFVSVVSHELRTPLSITKEGISLVLDKVVGPLKEKQEKILGTARDNIDRLARIINNLLDVSKIEEGRVELKKEMVDLNVLIKEVIASFLPAAKDKKIQLKQDLSAGAVSVYVDKDAIVRVFTNLIGNAFKFTDKGFIKVTAAFKGDEVECAVSDSGRGIPPEDIKTVFDKFKQIRRAVGPGEKGTGLGLAIAKGIVEMHGGSIWAESPYQDKDITIQGARFIFTLPAGNDKV
ncbi:MAG: PAS domain S-box protein [Candidatus Omnitrophica bacterium]|nr:PAS domain S-box protein [Candidatus Omnitrophota bacterium]